MRRQECFSFSKMTLVSQNDYTTVTSPSWMSVGKTKNRPETDDRHKKKLASYRYLPYCQGFQFLLLLPSPTSFFKVHTTFFSAPILTSVNLFLFILFLTLLATTSSTSSLQLKFCWCCSDKYFFTNSKCSRLISRLFDFLIVFSFEWNCSFCVFVLEIILKPLFNKQVDS